MVKLSLGNVCMDMTMVDVLNIEASEGDDVVIFLEKIDIRNWQKTLQDHLVQKYSQASVRKLKKDLFCMIRSPVAYIKSCFYTTSRAGLAVA